LGSILLVSAIVLSMTLLMTFTATPVLTKLPVVIDEPGGDTITVYQGATFTIQFKLAWNEPGLGYFSLGIYWDSPRKDNLIGGTENENFTFVSASAYLEDNHDNIPVGLIFSEGLSPENYDKWRHHIVVDHTEGYPWDDNFYVDIMMRASGYGGVPHVPTNNHPIVISGTIDIWDGVIYSYEPPNPYITITIEVLRGVAVTISPSENSGPPGATLNYSVTVTNTGTLDDNYALTISDNESWGPTLNNYLFENVQPGESRTATLSVTVPENAVPEDNITVIATSQADNTVSDNDSCIARATYWTGTAVFRGLENLYAVRLEKNLDLYQGSKLVVKFYFYDNTYENEVVIENFVPPWHVEENEKVPNPTLPWCYKSAVKKARLDLTTDNTENVISTIATWTTRKSHLITRIGQIRGRWPFADTAERSKLWKEISDIRSLWVFAPS